ncbi:hypothetical protein Tco_0821489 [Tanacetum coccineum]|uniref:Uncharacterized protein n=1 Tax=Tanacetum coccineum TaxID=301880 RepID=A0ABQ5ACD6_9ASTR
MPPRRLKKKSIKRLVEKRVAKAIEEYEKSRANLDSAGSSGGNPGNAGGTMNVHGCSHKTFMNGKPHTFNGTEGVVGEDCSGIRVMESYFENSLDFRLRNFKEDVRYLHLTSFRYPALKQIAIKAGGHEYGFVIRSDV